jgi:tRNA-dihydrouridine synthase B
VKHIPVIGNGDVTTAEAARHMLNETGCSGVGIGRGAFYNPWIFSHTAHYLRTGELLSEPTFEERIRVMCRHFELMIEVFGEEHGSRMFRKVAPWYSKRFGPANEFNKRVVTITSKVEFYRILESYVNWRVQFVDETGMLKPNYRPAPLMPSFMQPESPAITRERLPVPKGPVELW